ncbi:MAG: hypothetical protein CMD33_03640 [Flavobacteriales bacterium]|nr:hypothetical protein [Flavobacteriales bacterium]
MDDRYELGDYRLGKGAFGQVVTAHDRRTKKTVACKKQPRSNRYEYRVLMSLSNSKASSVVPEPLSYSEESDGSSFLFMDKMDVDLGQLAREVDMQNDFRLLLSIAINLFKSLGKVHDSGWLHRDIEPGNIMLRDGSGRVYLVDFGMAKKYRSKSGGEHIPFVSKKKTVVGTAKYLSTWGHRHMQQSRRDDCASAMYTLAQVANGRLPWAKGGKQKPNMERVFRIKRETTAEDLFGGLPQSFVKVHRLVASLGFYDRPAYKRYIEIFLRDIRKL